MDITDAEFGDIYVDPQGKLWRVVGICREPTVTLESVEGRTEPPIVYSALAQGQIAQSSYPPPAPPIIKDRKHGGISGLMWEGFKRIWRQEPK